MSTVRAAQASLTLQQPLLIAGHLPGNMCLDTERYLRTLGASHGPTISRGSESVFIGGSLSIAA